MSKFIYYLNKMFHTNYSPNNLESLDFNSEISKLSIFNDIPHLLIYGGNGM